MHIRELVARTGSSERQVRYLIAEGFISPPTGGRAMADYGETHVEAVQRYMHLRELGFPPAAIRKLLEAKEGAPFPVAPGITLVVDPTSCTAARTSRRSLRARSGYSSIFSRSPRMTNTAMRSAIDPLYSLISDTAAHYVSDPIPLIATHYDIRVDGGFAVSRPALHAPAGAWVSAGRDPQAARRRTSTRRKTAAPMARLMLSCGARPACRALRVQRSWKTRARAAECADRHEVTGAANRPLSGLTPDGGRVSVAVTPLREGQDLLDLAILVDRSGSMNELCSGFEAGTTKHQAIAAGLTAVALHRKGDGADPW